MTCVEDRGSQRGRSSLVQEEFLHQHARGSSGKPPLQRPHPEEIEVTMETERDQSHVPRAAPVQVVRAREPLVDEVPSGEQAAVQTDVCGPRKTTEMAQTRTPHTATVTAAPGTVFKIKFKVVKGVNLARRVVLTAC